MKTFKITQLAFVLSLACTSLIATQTAHAHCQVPCGIYDDSARLQTMLEDAATITKATTQLAELAGKHDAQSINQSTRWVLNKEQHAQRIIATISDYYLTQRVKPSQADYTERLAKHHAVIIAAMQAKQHADSSHAAALTEKIEALAAYYPVTSALDRPPRYAGRPPKKSQVNCHAPRPWPPRQAPALGFHP